MEVLILPAMNAELPLDPPQDHDRDKLDDLVISMAHDRLSLPSDVNPDEDAEVFITGPNTAMVYLTLAVPVELP